MGGHINQSAQYGHIGRVSPPAAPAPAPPLDPRLLQNLLLQDFARHGVQNAEERQKFTRLIKSISNGVDDPPFFGSGRHNGTGGLSSPELRGEIGGGILDLHSIDDSELLSEDGVHGSPFEISPFVTEKGFQSESDVFWSTNNLRSGKARSHDEGSPMRAAVSEVDLTGKDNSSGLARIKVVVRKRPLNKKELARREEDIVTIDGNGCSLVVHEPKVKVDLTAYVEKHDFMFDAVLDEQVSNDEVYRVTIEPIIPTIFQRTKATCFAYGQTGSGKTYTMQPLPLRACQDILNIMHHPSYRNQGMQLWLSFFEIYGGKLYDLLSDRRKLCMREDGRQQVCIVGLREFCVSDVELVKEYIEKGNASRSTGSTGANEESSRSHAILQLAIKRHANKKEDKGGKLVGKFSFIDLAGSERGADTTDNDRQTRIEGAEINKSLLALKECIRALDAEQGHIPFRGSKLTEVLRDSFVGDSRTVMISCISPNAGSCEHTLNTLRYADRVKGLSKNGNSKRDPSPSMGTQMQKDPSPSDPSISPEVLENMERKSTETRKQVSGQGSWPSQPDIRSYSSSNQGSASRNDSNIMGSFSADREFTTVIAKDSISNGVTYHRELASETKAQEWASSPRRNMVKNDRLESCKDYGSVNEECKPERTTSMQNRASTSSSSFKEEKLPNSIDAFENGYDSQITAILEEEEDLIAAHRLEVEDTMELVREEMRLLTEIDRPGSRIDKYVSELSYVLSRKASGIVNLQARLARFQRHLKEQEILKKTDRNHKS